MTKRLRGLCPPVITIFREDGSFDADGQASHVDFLIRHGAKAVIPLGSSGEFVAMTTAERKRVAEVCIEATAGRVPIYIGTAHYTTDISIELSQHAEQAGADGIMVITPAYLRRYPVEMARYFETVAAAVDIPMMLYHNPHFSGVSITDEFIADLYHRGIIASVKEGEGEVARLNDLRYLTDDGFTILYGFDAAPIEALSAMADGWVAGTANVIPGELSKLAELIEAGKVEDAIALWHKVKPYIDLCTKPREGLEPPWLAILKAGLTMRGEVGGYPRKPAFTLDELGDFGARVKDELRAALAILGHV